MVQGHTSEDPSRWTAIEGRFDPGLRRRIDKEAGSLETGTLADLVIETGIFRTTTGA
jgi:hypothetical protein